MKTVSQALASGEWFKGGGVFAVDGHEDLYAERVAQNVIPQDDKERKDAPVYRGLMGYFPYALFKVAEHSYENDKKHNGENTHGPTWKRGASTDHLDALGRHMLEIHTSPDYHLAAIAWRALAALQERGEALGFAAGASSRG